MHNRMLVLLAVLMVPLGQAQFFETFEYEDTAPFSDGFRGIPALVSGQTSYEATDAQNVSVFFGTNGVSITGMDAVYWRDGNGNFQQRSGPDLEIRINDGGSFAFRTPGAYNSELDAPHALSFFMDSSALFEQEDGSKDSRNDMLDGDLGPALATIPLDDTIQITDVETIPAPPSFQALQSNIADYAALIVSMSEATNLTVFDADAEVATLSGVGDWIGMQGTPVFSPISADLAVLAMPPGASATFAPSEPEDAERGLEAEHLAAAFSGLTSGPDNGAEGDSEGGFFDNLGALAPFLNGAYVDLAVELPTADDPSAEGEEVGITGLFSSATLVRFDSMEATRGQGQVNYEGDAALQVTDGEVAGAEPLVGGVIPSLSIVLWVVALGATVAMFVLRPSKNNKLWDGFHLIGRISGPVAMVVAFFIWDAAIANLLGASILQGGLSGTGRAAIAVIQIVPLLLAGLFFGVPTRLIFRAGTRFAGQGRMMNIGNTVAPFVTILFGLPLLLSLVNSALGLLN